MYVNLDHSPSVEAAKAGIDSGFEFIHIDYSQANRDARSLKHGISVSSVYVRSDGPQLRKLAELLGAGTLELPVGPAFHLDDAPAALAAAVRGGGGAIALML